MKTNVLTTALLACSIQVMVSGQTPANQSQRILPVIGDKSSSQQKTKPLPVLISSVENEKQSVTKKSADVLLSYSQNLHSSSFTKEHAEKLLIESETLFEAGQIIRNDCAKGKDKQSICEAFVVLQQQAQSKQVIALEIKGKVNYDQYALNNNLINSLLAKLESGIDVYQNSASQKQQSAHLMKLAREMREEAYSLENISALIGTLSNAEEKEKISLDTQFNTIATLKKAVAFYLSFNENALVLK